MAEVTRTKQLDPLRPFIVLRDLGAERGVRPPSYDLYESLNPVLRKWLDQGTVDGAIVTPPVDGLGATTPAERRDLLLEQLESTRKGYVEKYEGYGRHARTQPSLLGAKTLWPGLWDHIEKALDQLREAVADFSVESSATAAIDL